MARQTDQRLVTRPAEDGRLAGLDGDTVQKKFSQLADDPAGSILDARAAAAREDHRVAVFCRIQRLLTQELLIIHNDAEVHRFSAEFLQQRRKHRAVDVPHLPRAGLPVCGHKFIAGGNHAHAQPRSDRYLRFADGSERPDILRGKHPAGAEHCLAGEYVVAAENEVHARHTRLQDADGSIPVVFGVFDHHRAVTALRDRTTGWYVGAGVQRNTNRRTFAHFDLPREIQDRRDGVRAAESVLRVQGVAVHCGAVKIRDIFLRADIFGQHTAKSLGKGYRFAAVGGIKDFFNQPENLLRRFHFQHGSYLRHDLPQIVVIIAGEGLDLLFERLGTQDLQQGFALVRVQKLPAYGQVETLL